KEQLSDEEFASIIQVAQYPPSMARRTPDWMTPLSPSRAQIPKQILELMEEIYLALQSGSRRLVAMGIRTALEQVMRAKVGDHRRFSSFLDAFQAEHYISIRQRNNLEAIINAGHASAHRGWQPSDPEISTLLDITEGIVETVFIHEWRAAQLDKKVPRS